MCDLSTENAVLLAGVIDDLRNCREGAIFQRILDDNLGAGAATFSAFDPFKGILPKNAGLLRRLFSLLLGWPGFRLRRFWHPLNERLLELGVRLGYLNCLNRGGRCRMLTTSTRAIGFRGFGALGYLLDLFRLPEVYHHKLRLIRALKHGLRLGYVRCERRQCQLLWFTTTEGEEFSVQRYAWWGARFLGSSAPTFWAEEICLMLSGNQGTMSEGRLRERVCPGFPRRLGETVGTEAMRQAAEGARSQGFLKALQEALGLGWVTRSGDEVTLTAEGRETAERCLENRGWSRGDTPPLVSLVAVNSLQA